jgi:hypothetical protein
MNPLYNPRQRKVYNDYRSWLSEKLSEILKTRDNFNPDIIGVITDILKERKVPIPEAPVTAGGFTAMSGPGKSESEKERGESEITVKKFISELQEVPIEEINGIITRYSYFQAEKLEAALFVAVERGFITYDLRESLHKQMTDNLGKHWDRKATFKWEKENAFRRYVSGYSDEKIYEIIDDPNGMVIDAYHAVLLTALERELISKEDFNMYFSGAKSALTTDLERSLDDFRNLYDLPQDSEDLFDETSVGAYASGFRKCPSCGEIADADLSVCWNCQAEIPESAPVPGVEEMRKELISGNQHFALNPFVAVFLIAAIMFVGDIARNWIWHKDIFHHKWFFITDGIFLGLMILWFGAKYFNAVKE